RVAVAGDGVAAAGVLGLTGAVADVVVGPGGPVRVGAADNGLGGGRLASGGGGGPRVDQALDAVVVEALVGDGGAGLGLGGGGGGAGRGVGVGVGALFVVAALRAWVFGVDPVGGQPAGGFIDGRGQPHPGSGRAEQPLVRGPKRVVRGAENVGGAAGQG